MPFWRHEPRVVFALLRSMPVPLQRLLVYLASPKFAAGVSATICDAEHRILIVHHTYRRPGWGLPSGLVRRGEQPEATLIRELREELDVAAVVESMICTTIERRYRHLTLHYRVRLLGAPRVVGHEIDEIRFVGRDEMRRLTGGPVPSWLDSPI